MSHKKKNNEMYIILNNINNNLTKLILFWVQTPEKSNIHVYNLTTEQLYKE